MAKENITCPVAWDVEIDHDHCIVFATSAAKARWIAVKGYREAGYNTDGSWPNPRAGRVPKYDNSPLRDKPPKCWAPDYVLIMGESQ